jgi:hypothetical protein
MRIGRGRGATMDKDRGRKVKEVVASDCGMGHLLKGLEGGQRVYMRRRRCSRCQYKDNQPFELVSLCLFQE